MVRSSLFPFIITLAVFVAGCVAIPTRNEAAAYTRVAVQDAIRLYRSEGRQAVIDYYSAAENVDGQWYVFVIGEDGRTIAHYRNERIGATPPSASIQPDTSTAMTS